ncbi:peptidase U32 family protein [Ruminococcus albus]|uniref:Peptidase U32 n=1 Tax=Ruminococcus albus SY3 TaxID=1341156 RepID=A0A011UX56_RUMAL|nr:U32 family peptidase [Ruminococcus albus]EXM37797.1 peptidase U32 [Ruminococcus albus SY3]
MSDLLEILSPVGDMERLHAALDFGADAVYLGGTAFGMRAASAKFTPELLSQACELAHSRGKRVFLTCNTLPHNNEIPHFESFVKNAVDAGVDALIVTDIGLLSLAKKYAPDTEIHISTQAGIVNYVTANEFYNMGAKRVVLARELTLEEIAEIRAKTPDDLDIECFVHGAMCVSFSGRCLLSQYLTSRDANRGECAQPCRWGYHLMEEKRTNEFYPIFEDERGTFILNAKDMCLIEHIDKLAKAGVNSFKIEGRAKSSYYVSVITNAYRKAMDIYKSDPDNYHLPQWLKDEVYKVSHRAYCPGFLFGNPRESQYYENSGYVREYDVVAVIEDCRDGRIYAEQRNKFNKGDEVEVLSPDGEPVILTASELFDEKGEPIETANHAAMKFSMTCDRIFPKNSIIRIKK